MKKIRGSIQRFLQMLQADKKDITAIYTIAIFTGLLNLSVPLGIQAIINLINGATVSTSWIILVIAVMLGMTFAGILQIKQLTIVEHIQQKLITRGAFDFGYRLPRMKQTATDRMYLPEMVNRFFDILTIQKGLPKILIDFSTAALQITLGIIILTFYHPFFVVFGFVLVLLLVTILALLGPRGLSTSLVESKHKYALVHWLEEIARTVLTFKLSGTSALAMKGVDRNTSNYLTARQKHFKNLLQQFYSLLGFKVVVSAGLLVIGSILVFNQEMNIGQFVAAELIVLIIISSVEKVILSMESIYDVLTAMEKVGSVTDVKLEEDKPDKLLENPDGKGLALSLSHFSFQFDNGFSPFADLNLDIKSGEKIVVSGPSGSGKSLLLNILCGLYDEYEGTFFVNDIPLNALDLCSLRYQIGDSFAEESVFKGTIGENIHLGRPKVSEEHLKEACELLKLDEYIYSHPDGLSREIDPEGMNMPKLLRLKIILARCLVGHPKLLAMEDSINMLEMSVRNELTAFLFNKKHPATLLMTSNDPHFISKADRVLFLQNKGIAFDGTPDEFFKSPFFKLIEN
jgi:ABC-type bacteriocin/lantibiotic exporter with double-glycine peptidase domain